MASFWQRLKYVFTGTPPADAVPRPMAKIDAAQTSDENRRHWAQADSYSADAAYNVAQRFVLRNRARYETVNNCYAKASVRSAGDDLIGTGPRIQLSIPGDDTGASARAIERSFGRWGDATQLPINLRVAEKSHMRDGECFGIFVSSERVDHPVKLFLRWVEAEMCATPFTLGTNPYRIDGMLFDENGLVIEYYFLTNHPGNIILVGFDPLKFYTVPADRVVHWYSKDRFGQHRAIPEITPALPLYSQVRRYTLAALTAAEFAAMLAGIMKTKAAPDTGESVTSIPDWTPFEMIRGALLTLPEGWEATQFKSENPPTGYGEFKRELLNESGRSTNQPLNVVTGNSSGYNYSSGRLDHLPYQRGLRIERNDLRLMVLDPIFKAWYAEAVLVGEVPANLPPIEQWAWTWTWDGFDSIDQNKDATADDTRIKNGTATYSEILSEYGQDWMMVFEQIAREKAYAESLGLPFPILSGAGNGSGSPAEDTNAVDGNEQPVPETPEDAVQFALSEAGVAESVAAEVMGQLAPTFELLRQRGFRFSANGHAKKE